MHRLYKISANLLIALLSLFFVFHILILIQLIPFTLVWGGRLHNVSEMHSFESVSLLLNAIMLCIVLIKQSILKIKLHSKIIKVSLWLMFLLFALNTLGNLNSQDYFEKVIFTPITFLLSLCSLILAIEKKEK